MTSVLSTVHRGSAARPWHVLAITLGLLAIAAVGVTRLELRTGGRALVPRASEAVETDRDIRELFGLRDDIAVVIRTPAPGGIFAASVLGRLAALTSALAEMPGVRPVDVISLATEQSFRHQPGALTFRRLLEPVPEDRAALEQLREDLRRIELYDGTLVSFDDSSAAIFVGVSPQADRLRLVADIRALIADSPTTETGESIEIVGAPVAEALLGHHILSDLGLPAALLDHETGREPSGERSQATSWSKRLLLLVPLVPAALVIMGLVFFVAFRRVAAALMPLAEAGGCLLIVFGLMGWLGVPIYLTTSVLPLILTAIGVADEIHIFRRFAALGRRPGLSRRSAVDATLDEMAPPVLKTSLTTAAAFLSFALSPIGPVRIFGLFAAFGVLVCLAWSLTVVPALLVLVPRERWLAGERSPKSLPFLPGLAALGARRPRALLAFVGILLVIASLGASRVEVQDSWIDGFAEGSSFAQSTRHFDRQFLGSHRLLVEVSSEVVHLVGEIDAVDLGDFALTLPETGTASLAGSSLRLFEVRAADSGSAPAPKEWRTEVERVERDEQGRLLLSTPRQRGSAKFWLRPKAGDRIGYEIHREPLMIPELLAVIGRFESFVNEQPGVGGVLGPARFLETVGFMMRPDDPRSRALPAGRSQARIRWHNYDSIRGADRRGQLVTDDYGKALVSIYLRDSNYAATEALMTVIEDFAAQQLEPNGVSIRFGGDVAVSQALIDGVVTTQLRSLLLSFVGIFLVASLLLGSWRWGLCCLLPPTAAVLSIFVAMGLLDIPLGVATSMFAGMTLGVGVDFAIHLVSRYQKERVEGRTVTDAVSGALGKTGPAVVTDACAVALGFGILTLSQVPANARLGALLVLSVLGCLAVTLLVVPTCIRLLDGERESREVIAG